MIDFKGELPGNPDTATVVTDVLSMVNGTLRGILDESTMSTVVATGLASTVIANCGPLSVEQADRWYDSLDTQLAEAGRKNPSGVYIDISEQVYRRLMSATVDFKVEELQGATNV